MDKKCSWITLLDSMPDVIIGAEDDGDNGDGSSDSGDSDKGAGNASDKSGGDAGSGSNDDKDDDNEHDDKDDPNVRGLKSALKAERAAAKAAAAEAKTLREEKEARELADKSEVERAQAQLKKAEERAAKLATGFLNRSLNDAIRSAAEKSNFIDTNDAIEGIKRDSITFEQDKDDPSDIDIDMKSVERAVKDLAARKPHYLKQGTDDGDKSGSQFGGSKRPKDKKSEEETLKEYYPSLN